MRKKTSGSNWFNRLLSESVWEEAKAVRLILTPELAQHFLDNMVEDQRMPYASTIERYVEEILNDEWLYTGQGIVVSSDGKVMNGQHTCHAVIKAGKEIEILVVYDVDRDAFFKMDAVKKRTNADYLPGPNKNTRAQLSAALRLLFAEENMSKGSDVIHAAHNYDLHPGKTKDYLLNHHPRLQEIERPKTKFLQPGPLLYCLYRTSEHDARKSKVFWAGVLEGDNLGGKHDPRRVLHNRLLRNVTDTTKLPQGTIIAYVIKAWTSFLRGENMGVLRLQGSEDFPSWPGGKLEAEAA